MAQSCGLATHPSSPCLAPTMEGSPFSSAASPRLLLPRDKLSSSPPEWDRVKFRSSSAPSSSAREGTVRCTLIASGWSDRGLGAPMGDLEQAGRWPLTPHWHPTPKNRLPFQVPVNLRVLALTRGPPGNPRVAMGLRGWWGPDCIPGGAFSPPLGPSATFLDRTHVKGVKNNPSLCYCKRTLLGLQGRARTQSSEGQFPVPLRPAFP